MKDNIRLQIPFFIAARIALNTAIRMVYPYLPVFARGLGVDLWQISRALTLRSIFGILGPLLASLGDSRGRKTGILLGLILFTGGAGLIAVWPTFPAFVLALMLTLVGNVIFVPSLQAYLGDRVAYRQRGLALSLIEIGWSLSFILGVPLAGYLIARYNWQAPFLVLAICGVLILGLVIWLMPADRMTAGNTTVLHNLRKVFTFAPALLSILLGVFFSSSNEVINILFGAWMEDTLQVKIGLLTAASLVIGLSELSGELLVSGLTDRIGKHRAVAGGLALNCLAALALPLLGASGINGALLGLFAVYITFEFTMVSSIPLISEVLPAARATMMATFIAGTSLGRALGALLAPFLYSLDTKLWAVVLAAACLNLLGMLALRGIHHAHPEAAGT